MANRTTIEFGDRAAQELEKLTQMLDAPSKAEVIRNSLSLYAFLVNEVKDGRKLAIVEGGKIEQIIAVPGLNVQVPVAAD